MCMYTFSFSEEPIVKHSPVYHWPHINKKGLRDMFLASCNLNESRKKNSFQKWSFYR